MAKIPTDYVERCYAGWLGKVIGVRHGAPIEGWSYEKIKTLLGEITDYPVDYHDFAADDDTNGPLFFLRALNDYTHTRAITAEQIGLTWLNYAAFEHGFYWWGGYGRSTEHTAYLNLKAGLMAPRSGSIAQNGAAVAEQIGGQIFIDTWGLITPGDPALAAEYAGKAASVSHDGNGIWGGQFVAAAISAAFTSKGVRDVLETALSLIPETCEYALMVRDIMRFYDHEHEGQWRDCMEYILARWGYDRYPGVCHIIPNGAVMIMSMLYGEGSFDKTINICNMAGWDTDCNVGNVGTILGVLVGLDGIDYDRWRRPINDFLAASSVVGCMNIMNLPQNVRDIANLAYQIQEEEPPEEWAEFLSGKHTFDFSLPGSTCAFRVRPMGGKDGGYVFHEADVFESGNGALRVLFPQVNAGDERYVYHRTYYRPSHFHDSRYDPAFSPILYPGQRIEASVSCVAGIRLRACVYAYDSNGGKEYCGEAVELEHGKWQALSLCIPPLDGGCVEEVGIKVLALEGTRVEAALYLDHLSFRGNAEYTLDFARERMEEWTPLHREVSQMTCAKGLWEKEEGLLRGSCADYAEAYTGDVHWAAQEITCRWKPNLEAGDSGFALRVQGAARGYAIWLSQREISIEKNENGYRVLAKAALPSGLRAEAELTARAEGNKIEVLHQGKALLSVQDTENPYLTGMVGLVLRRGGCAFFRSVSVKTR